MITVKNIKPILLIACLVLISVQTKAQKNTRERVKTYKIAFITEQLDLTSSEAERFWPIYNEHQREVRRLKRSEKEQMKSLRSEDQNASTISESQANQYIDQHLMVTEKKAAAHKKLIVELRKFLPNKKILKLIKAERDFNKRLLDRFKEKRRQHRPN